VTLGTQGQYLRAGQSGRGAAFGPDAGWVKTHPAPERAQRIAEFALDPKRRGAATRMLKADAEGVVRIAKEIAAKELRQDRNEARRPKPNQGKPHYVESFVITQVKIDSPTKMSVRWDNDHPAAAIIEYGSRPHVIATRKNQIFPYNPRDEAGRVADRVTTPGGPPGVWAANTGEAVAFIKKVNHPGSPAFHIFRRAVQRYHRRNR
jgi:hypothetical protein